MTASEDMQRLLAVHGLRAFANLLEKNQIDGLSFKWSKGEGVVADVRQKPIKRHTPVEIRALHAEYWGDDKA